MAGNWFVRFAEVEGGVNRERRFGCESREDAFKTFTALQVDWHGDVYPAKNSRAPRRIKPYWVAVFYQESPRHCAVKVASWCR